MRYNKIKKGSDNMRKLDKEFVRQEFEKDANNKNISYPDDFKANADKIFKEIIAEAKKLKEDSEKKYNEQLKSLKFDK